MATTDVETERVQNVRTENSEIDVASIFYHFPRVVRGPFLHRVW